MKILKTLSVAVLLTGALVSSTVYGKVNPTIINYAEIPAKTVVLKHPAAENTTNYFSSATVITFEVYKVGAKAEMDNVTKVFLKEGAESCIPGGLTGDYQAYTISLKTAKDKAWFAATFRKAGLNSIKINNNAVVSVDQM